MTRRGVFLADGPSDLPLRRHVVRICALEGLTVDLTVLEPHGLPPDVRRTVADRLRFIRQLGATIDIVFVHRDAEGEHPDVRRDEVRRGVAEAEIDAPFVPIVPVRMTEAWLLLDEIAIREVAARPLSRRDLHLPTVKEVERIADPKARLRSALLEASETTGRRRETFKRDFNRHRRLLLERLDPDGPVARLSAWRALRRDIASAAERLHQAER